MLKRLFDVFVAVLLSFPAMVPGLIIALAIHIEGAGPIFYRSRRIGVRGEEFHVLKFRTMYPDGDKRLSEEHRALFQRDYKLVDDPRVTPIGRWLRRTSLDELPQLLNVLRGEMSMVGPRPKLPDEIDLYGAFKDELLSVRPGITGYWQVFRKTKASDETMRRMDIYYIRNRSDFMDLGLLLLTPLVMITRTND